MIVLLPMVLLRGQDERPKFAVRSNLVSLPTRVQTKTGETIYGLRADQFIVEDNGVRQKISMDQDPESEGLSLVVAVQCGASAEVEFRKIKGLGALIDGIVGGGPHEVAILAYGQAPYILGEFSDKEDAVTRALARLQSCGSYAATIDTVYYAMSMLNRRQNHYRRAIVLISEMRDHGSKSKLEEVVSELGVTDTTIYSVTFAPTKDEFLDGMRYGEQRPPIQKFKAPPGEKAGDMPRAVADEHPSLIPWPPQLLLLVNALRANSAKELATLSGGENFSFTNQGAFERALQRISNEIHNYYTLSFVPQGGEQMSIHKVQVRVPDYPDAVIQTRRSYWMGISER